MSAWVYITASRKYGTLYLGVTNDLVRRMQEHKDGQSDFTSRYKVQKLVWAEEHATMPLAIMREKTMKGWSRAWKIQAIEKLNPDWNDLHEIMHF